MPTLVIEPPARAVSLKEARQHLRVGDLDGEGELLESEDDPYIEGLIDAAQMWIDGPPGWLGRAIGIQTLENIAEDFFALDDTSIPLPFVPIQSIVSVTYTDPGGEDRAMDPNDYAVAHGAGIRRIGGRSWPQVATRADAVRIRYVAGYSRIEGEGDAAELVTAAPQPVKQAILLLVGQWYANRSAINVGNIVNKMPFAVEALLSPYRIYV